MRRIRKPVSRRALLLVACAAPLAGMAAVIEGLGVWPWSAERFRLGSDPGEWALRQQVRLPDPAQRPEGAAVARTPSPPAASAGAAIRQARAPRARPSAAACPGCGVVDGIRALETVEAPSRSRNPLKALLAAVGPDRAREGRSIEAEKLYLISVRMEDGRRRSFAQAERPRWRPGDRVQVVGGQLRPLRG